MDVAWREGLETRSLGFSLLGPHPGPVIGGIFSFSGDRSLAASSSAIFVKNRQLCENRKGED